MIDLHCHILPGVDDGPDTLQQSVHMARKAVADGISIIVATPHIRDDSLHAETISGIVSKLNRELQTNGIPVKIIEGGEMSLPLSDDLIIKHTINGGRFVLIEFPHTHLPKSASEDLFRIRGLGLIPIIAHPERNPSIIQNPDLLLELLDSDVLCQVTAGSLCGEFGRSEQQCARYLLKKGAVDILATDAHDARYRKPVLSKGLKIASRVIGIEKAKQLVFDTPRAVIYDQVQPDSLTG